MFMDFFIRAGRRSAAFRQERLLHGRIGCGSRLDVEIFDFNLEFFLCNVEHGVFQKGNIAFHDPFSCERGRGAEGESGVGKRQRLHGTQPVIEREFGQRALIEDFLQDLLPNRLQF